MKKAVFGPAGSETAFSEKYNSSLFMPGYLKDLGLDAFEYQCGRGVNISDEKAAELGAKASENGIVISLHSPYFINLSNADSERVERNVGYILQSCRAVNKMGGDRVVVHCGGLSGRSREEAFRNTLINVKEALGALEATPDKNVSLCIETMGKVNVLGDLDEVLDICLTDDRLLPCIDFGHLNARTHGALSDRGSFEAALDRIINKLGKERAERFHAHFSRIEFSTGGEVRHLTFENEEFGPSPDLISSLVKKKLYPTVICESAGTQAHDAAILKDIYMTEVNKNDNAE